MTLEEKLKLLASLKDKKKEKVEKKEYTDVTVDLSEIVTQLAEESANVMTKVLIGPKGEKGEKGDKGDTGIQGEKGERGETGPRGLQGIQGIKGDKGETGAQGPVGPQGMNGRDGSPDTPKDIVQKLESLNGDERLSFNAIKGMDDVQKRLDEAKKQGIVAVPYTNTATTDMLGAGLTSVGNSIMNLASKRGLKTAVGRLIDSPIQMSTAAGTAINDGTVYGIPIWSDNKTIITTDIQIAQTAGTSGGVLGFAVYSDNNGKVGNLIYDSGPIANNSATTFGYSAGVTLTWNGSSPMWVMLGVGQSTSVLFTSTTAFRSEVGYLNSSDIRPALRLQKAITWAGSSFPDTFTSPTYSTNGGPAFRFTVGAIL